MSNLKRVNIILPEELHARAKERAEREGVSVSAIVRAFLVRWLDNVLPSPDTMPAQMSMFAGMGLPESATLFDVLRRIEELRERTKALEQRLASMEARTTAPEVANGEASAP